MLDPLASNDPSFHSPFCNLLIKQNKIEEKILIKCLTTFGIKLVLVLSSGRISSRYQLSPHKLPSRLDNISPGMISSWLQLTPDAATSARTVSGEIRPNVPYLLNYRETITDKPRQAAV